MTFNGFGEMERVKLHRDCTLTPETAQENQLPQEDEKTRRKSLDEIMMKAKNPCTPPQIFEVQKTLSDIVMRQIVIIDSVILASGVMLFLLLNNLKKKQA